MLFILSLAAVMLALAATGLGFEQALILSISALSNHRAIGRRGRGGADRLHHAQRCREA